LSTIDQLYAIPNIDFVEKDIETLLAEMLADYQSAYLEATGENKTLAPGDPIRIWIYSQALKLYTAYQVIDYSAKQNLLKYATGDYLENLGARIGVTRLPASAAVSTVAFVLSAPQLAVISIPVGTRVSPGNNIFFETTEYAEVPIGQTSVYVTVKCTEAGTIGNDFTPGQINTLVDPIAYVASVVNTEAAQGGADVESDESLRERIFLRPDAFSVAGPIGAYQYFVKEYNQSILDVSVTSPLPGEVDVRFILTGGELPSDVNEDGSDGLIRQVANHLSAADRRPLTDHVTVGAPDVVNYNIVLDYYIRTADKLAAVSIQSAVNKAIDDYILWQRSKIGRDINPDELVTRIKAAGAKRVVIMDPAFTSLAPTQLAVLGTKTITYKGLEDE
jgi:phage-related baseplate assembly protein